MNDSSTTAHVSETGDSTFSVAINVSGHHLIGDEPAEAGGKGLGPSPYDLLVAALGECTAMTIRWYARQKQWPLERVEVTLTHAKGGIGKNPATVDHFTKSIRFHGDDLTNEQRAKLIDVAARCPIQRTLEGTSIISTIASG